MLRSDNLRRPKCRDSQKTTLNFIPRHKIITALRLLQILPIAKYPQFQCDTAG
jgi:hypothetical protein